MNATQNNNTTIVSSINANELIIHFWLGFLPATVLCVFRRECLRNVYSIARCQRQRSANVFGFIAFLMQSVRKEQAMNKKRMNRL